MRGGRRDGRRGRLFQCKERRRKGSGGMSEGSLMAVLYKVYMMELAERLKKKCEEERVIPQNQTGGVQERNGYNRQYLC